MTAEYVPAKASDEEYGIVDSKTSSQVKSRREKTRRFYGGENTFTVEGGGGTSLLSCINLPGDMQDKSTKARHEKRVWVNQGRQGLSPQSMTY